jgi:hypothetical protein
VSFFISPTIAVQICQHGFLKAENVPVLILRSGFGFASVSR